MNSEKEQLQIPGVPPAQREPDMREVLVAAHTRKVRTRKPAARKRRHKPWYVRFAVFVVGLFKRRRRRRRRLLA